MLGQSHPLFSLCTDPPGWGQRGGHAARMQGFGELRMLRPWFILILVLLLRFMLALVTLQLLALLLLLLLLLLLITLMNMNTNMNNTAVTQTGCCFVWS